MRELPAGIDLVGSRFRARIGSGPSRVSKVFASLGEAVDFRDAALQDIADGNVVLSDGLTVEDWGRRWLPRRKTRASFGNDRQRWKDHVVPHLGRRSLAAIARRDVKAWLRKLEAGGLALSTIRNCKSLLSVAFTDAVDDELVTVSPCDGVRVDMRAKPINENRYLLPAEQAALLAASEGPERHMIAVAMGAGIRRAELFSLHLSDVHVDRDPHLFVRFGGFAKAGKLKTPKNGKTRRVPLFGIALEGARAWLAELPAYATRNPHALVFPLPTGARRVYSRDLPPAWFAARKTVTRIKPWWHLLRHTCGSSLVSGWWGPAWSLHEVSALLGHSSVSVTERHYAHLAPSRLDTKASEMPMVTLVVTDSGKAPELHMKPLSRPGDLKVRPEADFSRETGAHDHAMTTRISSVLEGYVRGDPFAVQQAMALLAEMLPVADRTALARLGGET